MQKSLLSSSQITILYLLFALVYISGLFIPLMENDSAQHASMAMRMTLSDNFLELYKGDSPYLDKPHLHFWLAALFMKIFGINDIAYRIPAFLCIILAAYSTKKLADLLYENENLSYLASLIFLSSQTIILSAHDVRTDAVLTGFIIFSIWQLISFIKNGKALAALLSGFGIAMAFSSKGMMAVVIIGLCIFSYLIYSKEWKQFFNKKLLLVMLAFIIGVVPILYSYYYQFGKEGIGFILFNQSYNRMTAEGFEKTNSDYFFFFHSLLWLFLPFSILFYSGIFEKTIFLFRKSFKSNITPEFLTIGGFWITILLFSWSKFKLPHYMNGIIPILSIFTAYYLFNLLDNEKRKTIRLLYVVQVVFVFLSLTGIILLTFFFTKVPNLPMFICTLILTGVLLFFVFRKDSLFHKYVVVSFMFAICVNMYLNSQFYPILTQYQGSLKLARFVNNHHINLQKIRVPKGYGTWAFDFYAHNNFQRVDLDKVKSGDYLILNEEDMKNIKKKFILIKKEDNYRITKLSLKFLNPDTRSKQLGEYYMVQIL
ncbi:glycosyltransferase family 39 protein [Chryseobacterium sp.]|uniref:ArnT family glycosyltransferase n=1 Tax=Chryseobacterium sp. TaxID=1871047 RepID=UPI0025B9B157|nr:glycosyltransferase family 39 protein [Chryseobacterium sp.]